MMTFEKDFPSLELKDHNLAEWFQTAGLKDSLSKDIVDTYLFSSGDIKKHCLDKHVVDTKIRLFWRQWQGMDSKAFQSVNMRNELLKELGL